jgi:hypothetical protein
MKALSSFILLLILFLSIENVSARCKTKVIARYPVVVYSTPVVYQAYAVCPCSGTWGSPSCNCPDSYVYSCNSCTDNRYYPVPGHWHDNDYEVYYDMSSIYPTPYMYENTDVGYAIDP